MGNKKPMIREVSRGHGISLQSHLLEPKFPHMFKSNNQPSNLCFHDRTSSQIPSEPINLPTICIMKHPPILIPITGASILSLSYIHTPPRLIGFQ